MRIPAPSSLPAIAALLALSIPTPAAVYCVDSPVALRQALIAARGDGSSDEIRLVFGNYAGGGTVGMPAYTGGINGSENLEISGGWNEGCTAVVGGAESTILRGAFNIPVMSLDAAPIAGGLLILRRLTLADGQAANLHGGLRVNLGNAPASVLLDGLILRNNASGVAPAALLVESSHPQSAVRARNLLVHDNSTVSANAQGMARLTASGALWVSNLTVVGNRGSGGPTGNSGLVLRCVGAGCQGALSNTVIHGNTGGDALIERRIESDGAFQLRNNLTSGQRIFSGNFAGVVFNQDLALDHPMFTSPSSFLAAPGSPLINAGINLPPGGVSAVDVSAMPRIVAGTIDIGAYENELSVADPLFRHGFENP